jgi:hypothetical protein
MICDFVDEFSLLANEFEITERVAGSQTDRRESNSLTRLLPL